jgi:CheY-like chemotaxis protein
MPDISNDKGIILVVDNNPGNLRLLENILTQNGYIIRPAISGKLALMTIQSTLPDLILLGVHMPEFDGYSVCKTIKANETTRDIPVIFISTLDEPINKIKAFSVGCVDYITKPFESEEVLVRINTQINIRKMKKKLAEQNKKLLSEIAERETTENQLRKIRQELEIRVKERTKELEIAKKYIQAEIHQRKDAQRQLLQAQKLETIGTLSGGISHDFNNILSIIQTCSQLVMDDMPDNQLACVNMEKIQKASEKAKALVDKILSFSKHPIIQHGDQQQSKIQTSKAKASVPKGNAHVLLIDDESDLLSTVQLLLEHLGYQVTACMDPVEAFCEFEKNPQIFDIAIIDQAMPVMNGRQLTKKIKEIRKDLPVLISSGNSSELSDNEMDQLGINGFLLKPFLKKDLAESINRILSA